MQQVMPSRGCDADRKMPIVHLVVFTVLFFLAWTCYVWQVSPVLKTSCPALYIFDVFKLLIWTVPVFAYLKYENLAALSWLRLESVTRTGIKWAVIVSLVVIASQLAGKMVAGPLKFNLYFAMDKWIKGVILVGFTEEILFRGFLLQKIAGYLSFSWANLVTSLLFLLIHFPGWLSQNSLPPGPVEKMGMFAFIFIFSIIQGRVYQKTGSLWTCIIIHSINNCASYALGT
jgi:uncharacterized protein